jgi:NDP-4-keto-2,6-dideoxyhexose 3-C-methyltransferase
MSYKQINACRICGNKNLVDVLDLGTQTLTGVFPKSINSNITAGPLKLVKCHGDNACHLLQLKHTYDLGELYGDNYGYRSGLNSSMTKHLSGKVSKILNTVSLSPNDLVIDIGSNDGTTLGYYPENEYDLVGIDPTGEKFSKYYKKHIKLIPDFFSAKTVREKIGSKKAKVITSFSMFYDLENPVKFAREIASILSEDGIWVLEQSYMPTMIDMISYDTVCHEHLEYYGLYQIQWIANLAGLKIVDIEFNNINGGSFSVTTALKSNPIKINNNIIQKTLNSEIIYQTLEPYQQFSKNVEESKQELINTLKKIKNSGKTIGGIGASTKGNVILQYCNITHDLLPMIGEVNQEKYGLITPGSQIPITSEKELLEQEPDYILLLIWHFHEFFTSARKFKKSIIIHPLRASLGETIEI